MAGSSPAMTSGETLASHQFDRKTPAFPPAILIQLLLSGFADRSGHRQVGRAQLHARRILSTDSMKE
jgi:hypothetical protein